jgi:DNA-binding HxlR family transcriptional regulator
MSTVKNKKFCKELDKAIRMIGDVHVLEILTTLGKYDRMRFCELQRATNNLNPTTLTNRLKKLEKEKLISRKEETLDKVSVVYELTTKGTGILPIIHSINTFAEKYI